MGPCFLLQNSKTVDHQVNQVKTSITKQQKFLIGMPHIHYKIRSQHIRKTTNRNHKANKKTYSDTFKLLMVEGINYFPSWPEALSNVVLMVIIEKTGKGHFKFKIPEYETEDAQLLHHIVLLTL